MDPILKENLANLDAFWAAMPHTADGEQKVHNGWPHKIWRGDFDMARSHSIDDKLWVTIKKPNSSEYSRVKLRLLAMALKLDDVEAKLDKNVRITDKKESLKVWIKACSISFNYAIEQASIEPLLANPSATLFTYRLDDDIAGTAITYQTQGTMGVHQMGVNPAFRGRGVAKKLMLHLIRLAQQQRCSLVTLQASQAGQPLYEKIGFTALTEIYHLRSRAN